MYAMLRLWSDLFGQLMPVDEVGYLHGQWRLSVFNREIVTPVYVYVYLCACVHIKGRGPLVGSL